MPRRFPLYAKILGWFLLNLLLLGVIAWIGLQQQLRFGLDSLLAGRAGDRIRGLAGHALRELEDSPRANWDAVLKQFESAYPLQVGLFGRGGGQLAGTRLDLPDELRQRIQMAPPVHPRGPNGANPGRFRRGWLEDRRPEENERADQESGGRPPPPAAPPIPEIAGVVHAGAPPRYWITVRTPWHREWTGPDVPVAMVFCLESLGSGGLVLNLAPLAWTGAAVLVFSLLFWAPLVGGITRSIKKIRNATTEIAQGHFDVRLDDRRRDELGDLSCTINTMTERLDGLVRGQKRFLSDIAHELCAPISRLQMALGILEERGSEKDRDRLTDLREEVDQMSRLVNELLSFSRAALGARQTAIQAISVCELMNQVITRESFEGAECRVECADHLTVHADPHLLERALGNLVRNAIRYAAHAGEILVSAEQEQDKVVLSVRDSGPGVPERDLPKLFDPFYRVDASRTRDTGGVGLGLTIAKTCIDACRGTIAAANRPEGGLEVRIVLPSTTVHPVHVRP